MIDPGGLDYVVFVVVVDVISKEGNCYEMVCVTMKIK